MREQRDVSQGVSWAHALAIGTMQHHYRRVEQFHSTAAEDLDPYFVAVAEFVMWAHVVDDGFDKILEGLSSPSGATYRKLRDDSVDGRTVKGARWARNHIVHCLANPVADRAGVLEVNDRLDESAVGPDFRWLPACDVVSRSINPRDHTCDERLAYEELLADRAVLPVVQACMRWLSQVRYDYRDPDWAQLWFAAQT